MNVSPKTFHPIRVVPEVTLGRSIEGPRHPIGSANGAVDLNRIANVRVIHLFRVAIKQRTSNEHITVSMPHYDSAHLPSSFIGVNHGDLDTGTGATLPRSLQDVMQWAGDLSDALYSLTEAFMNVTFERAVWRTRVTSVRW